MQEVQLDARELKGFLERLEKAPAALAEARRKAFEEAAPKLKALVDGEIGGSGKVRSWQGSYVGTRGGYAAVRPKAKVYAQDGRGRPTKYPVGYVTNAVNSGHRFPSPSGKDKGYRPRVKNGRQDVAGRRFYEAAREKAQAVAAETAEELVQALKQQLEGPPC